MLGHDYRRLSFLLALIVLLLGADTASAYVGPGAGLELIGFAVSLLVMMATAFSAVCLWPIYRLIRWLRGGKEPLPPPEQAPAVNPEDKNVECRTRNGE